MLERLEKERKRERNKKREGKEERKKRKKEKRREEGKLAGGQVITGGDRQAWEAGSRHARGAVAARWPRGGQSGEGCLLVVDGVVCG